MPYDPRTARYRSFAEARPAFAAGTDTPRAFLERCAAAIEAREPDVKAFVRLDLMGAHKAADEAGARWRAGRPRSAVDGLPVGIKDSFDVRGFPTEANSAMLAGNFPPYDAAHVDAMRRGGAVILGKTVTTELTVAGPGPTWNPWDLRRTPGGSSSGSAAAVAAGMLPVATGSQVRGSVIRPASICGVVALKPTFGALNHQGGFDPSPSLNHLGLLAATLTDLWETAHHIAAVAGGSPGHRALAGGPHLPAARKPVRLARQYTPGWPKTDEESKAAFADFLRRLAGKGVEIVEPAAGADLAAYEDATARTPDFFFDLMLWEQLWPLRAGLHARPGSLSEIVLGYIEKAEKLTVADYHRACDAREALRRLHRGLAGRVDGFITLAHIGPGQIGQPKVGTPWYNDPSSAVGAPTLNLPLLALGGAPLGVQLMGFEGEDEALAAMGRWLLAAFESPLVGPG